MRRSWLTIAFAFAWLGVLPAQEDKPKRQGEADGTNPSKKSDGDAGEKGTEKKTDPEILKDLIAQFGRALSTYQSKMSQNTKKTREITKKLESAKGDDVKKLTDERNRMTAETRKAAEEFGKRRDEIAKNVGKIADGDSAASADAIIWLIQTATQNLNEKTIGRYVDRLTEKHVDHPKIGDVLTATTRLPGSVGEKLVEALIEKSNSKPLVGRALHQKVQLKKMKLDQINLLESLDEQTKKRSGPMVKRLEESVKGIDPKKLEAEVEELFDRIAKDYGEVELIRGRKLGSVAEAELFEIRNLRIGKVAPEIEGEDIFGKKMTLSQFRGKVVVLDFWGDW